MLLVVLAVGLIALSTTAKAYEVGVTPFRTVATLALLLVGIVSFSAGWPLRWALAAVVAVGVVLRVWEDLTRTSGAGLSRDRKVAIFICASLVGATVFAFHPEPYMPIRILSSFFVGLILGEILWAETVVPQFFHPGYVIGRLIGHAIGIAFLLWWAPPLLPTYFVVIGSFAVWDASRQWNEPLFLAAGLALGLAVVGGGSALGVSSEDILLQAFAVIGYRLCSNGVPGLPTLMMAFIPPPTALPRIGQNLA